MSIEAIKAVIRDVPDFPKPGILFRDITPLLSDAERFSEAVRLLGERVRAHDPDGLVAIESRGFLFGAAVAVELGISLELARKPGKLPYRTVGQSYSLEYGEDRIEMHVDAIVEGQRYAIIDDLIATGGTAAATAQLIESRGGHVVCCAFVIELADLAGYKRLGGRAVESLIRY